MLLSYRPMDVPDFYEQRRLPPSPKHLKLLQEWGIEIPQPMRFLKGIPLIEYRDLTKPADVPISLDDFKGRIKIPNWLDASHDLHFLPETIRMTVVKWGEKPEQRGRITIADDNWMGAFSIISYVGVTIGKNQAFAAGVVIMDCIEAPLDPHKPRGFDNCLMGPVIIGDNCWIGAHTIIMPGVTIGSHCTIGARSVVTKDIPSHSVALGNPAVVVTRYVDD